MLLHDLLGTGLTSNFQLEEISEKLFPNNFNGVFTANEWKDAIKLKPDGTHTYAIINTQTGSQGGEHWISLINTHENTYYYDSFGRTPKEMYKKWPTNWVPIIKDESSRNQSYMETDCGHRSIAALMTWDNYGKKIII